MILNKQETVMTATFLHRKDEWLVFNVDDFVTVRYNPDPNEWRHLLNEEGEWGDWVSKESVELMNRLHETLREASANLC